MEGDTLTYAEALDFILTDDEEENKEEENAVTQNGITESPSLSSFTAECLEQKESLQSRTKRHNYYAYADAGFIDKVKDFIEYQKTLVDSEYGFDNYIKLLISWRKWFDNYVAKAPTSVDELLEHMPPSWSPCEPLPIATIVTEGDAGTGKTFSLNTLLRCLPDGTASSVAKKGTDAFLGYAMADTIPGGMGHIIDNNTMCKMLKIKFSQQSVRARMEEVKNDRELEDSYATQMADMKGANDVTHATESSRKHFALAALKLWTLLTECNNEMMKDFMRYGTSAFRRTILDENHPHYTGDDLVPNLILPHHNRLKGAYKGEKTGYSVDEARLQVNTSESVLEQDGYRLSVEVGLTEKVNPPPPAALFPVLLFEEDGMAPAMYGDLRKLLLMLTLFTYQPPYMFSHPPIIVSSGSTTQSAAIGTIASALQMASTPAHLVNKQNVLAFKAEFFRRDKNSFKARDTLACRTTCMTLERYLPASEYTYTSMYTHEEHSNLVDDPGYLAEGTRLYCRHEEVRQYMRKMTKIGKAVLPVTDLVFVADNVVEITPSGLLTRTEGLSQLTERQANNNRLFMWKCKKYLYQSYEKNDTEEDKPKTTVGNVNVDFYVADNGCNAKTEEIITQAHREKIKKLAERRARVKNKETFDGELGDSSNSAEYEDFVECCDTGAVLASDETFSENAKDDVLYDRMVNGDRNRRVQKKRRINGEIVDQGLEKEEDNDQNKKIKTGLTFIVGRAVDLLSQEEHKIKRQHAEAIAQRLGKGKELAQAYLTGSKVVDQEGDMTYEPKGDLVVEYACPDYDCDDFQGSLHASTNARTLYMAFKRQRFMTKNAPVSIEKTDTKVVFRGIDCTLYELMQNDTFCKHGSNAFKAMVYGGVIDKFREWHIVKVDKALIMGSVDSVMLQQAYKLVASKIPEHARTLIDEYDRLVEEYIASTRLHLSSSEYPDKDQKKKEAKEHGLSKLTGDLERLVNRICNEGSDFISVKLAVYADRSPLYTLLRFHIKPVDVLKLRLIKNGDITFYGTGRSTCNAVWRMQQEKQYLENISSPGKYPPSMLRQEKCYCGFKHNTAILQLAFEEYLHELRIDCICTLSLGNCVLATTHPKLSSNVRWSSIFTNPKTVTYMGKKSSMSMDRFGLLMRRGMADATTPRSELKNNVFIMDGGEMMNLPRPFKANSFSGHSDVILKTRNLVISNTRNPRSTRDGEITDDELNKNNTEDLGVKRFESNVLIGCMDSTYLNHASTVASSQGSTINNRVLLNFTKITKDNRLVGLTRTSDTDKLKVADVSVITHEQEKPAATEKRETLRKRTKLMSSYYTFRQ